MYRAFENGRPNVETKKVPDDAQQILDSVWRKFGAHSSEHLTRLTMNHAPYRDAIAAAGPGEEITLKAMMEFYGRKSAARKPGTVPERGSQDQGAAPALAEVLRPRVMRSHTGRPVNVHRWMPRSLGNGRTEE